METIHSPEVMSEILQLVAVVNYILPQWISCNLLVPVMPFSCYMLRRDEIRELSGKTMTIINNKEFWRMKLLMEKFEQWCFVQKLRLN